jgi:hypothetical protein
MNFSIKPSHKRLCSHNEQYQSSSGIDNNSGLIHSKWYASLQSSHNNNNSGRSVCEHIEHGFN